MRTITIRLTDEEYGALERRAIEDRRTVRQMAERLVTKPEPSLGIGGADWTWRPQTLPMWQLWKPAISSVGTSRFNSNDCTITN